MQTGNILIPILIYLGGVFNLGFVIFHCFFWRVFRWKKDLASLARINRNIMQILNLCLIFVLMVFAFISIYYVSDLINTNLGRGILLAISLFWFLRGIEQIVFFGVNNKQSVIFTIIFFVGCLIFLVPFLLINYLMF